MVMMHEPRPNADATQRMISNLPSRPKTNTEHDSNATVNAPSSHIKSEVKPNEIAEDDDDYSDPPDEESSEIDVDQEMEALRDKVKGLVDENDDNIEDDSDLVELNVDVKNKPTT